MKKTFKKLFSGFCLVMAIVVGILLMPKSFGQVKTAQAETVIPTLTAEMYCCLSEVLSVRYKLSKITKL